MLRAGASLFASARLAHVQRGRGAAAPWARLMSSLPEHEVVGLPALSPTMEVGNIGSWRLQEGDSFGAGDVICEVETDKATVDFEAQDDGIVAKILQPDGASDIKVGQPIMVIVEDEADVPAFASYSPDSSAATEHSASATTPASAAPAATPAATPAAPAPPPSAAAAAPATAGDRVFASPYARTLARDAGINVADVGTGSGPRGRILADDVTGYLAALGDAAVTSTAPGIVGEAAAVTAASGPAGSFSDIPASDAARAYAAKMTLSKQTVPHYYLNIDVEVEALLELRASLNQDLPPEEHVSANDLLIKAAGLACKRVPDLNAAWMDTHVRRFHFVDVAVAVASDSGVVFPVVRGADSAGVLALGAASRDVHTRAQDGTLVDADLNGATITFSNLGAYGVKSASPVIVPPQSCHLAVGAIENRIVPNEAEDAEEIYREAYMMTAGVSCDHRTVDGAVAAQWLASFRDLVENPLTMLL